MFQHLLFPEEICHNRELDFVRTSRINSFFFPIPELARVLNGQKKGDSIKIDKIPAWVTPPGFEPRSSEPESDILSIELWGRYFFGVAKIVKFRSNPIGICFSFKQIPLLKKSSDLPVRKRQQFLLLPFIQIKVYGKLVLCLC